MNTYRLAVDIGGTFTDLVMINEATGDIQKVKTPSTPHDPSVGFIDAVRRVLRETAVSPGAIGYMIHGTTVATNTIIEGKGGPVALVTTEGFRDVLEIARQIRPSLYDIFCEKPRPLVPRHRCFGILERIDFAGKVLQELDEDSVRSAARQIRKEGAEAVAVCLLHSYINNEHERRVGAILAEELPGVFICLSSEICPEMREYFRASTTVINAIEMPVVTHYLDLLEERLSTLGIGAKLNLIASAGGVISSKVARREPVHLVESGPAAGVIAAAHMGALSGIGNIISFEMGGTTAKASLVEEGVMKVADSFEVGAQAAAESRGAGYPVRIPVLDLVEIGAGGGSIAWLDPGGALRVGPQSVGADPGPACYGRGGEDATITDANLVLGRLNPEYFLGGEFQLLPELAEQAVKRLADKLGLGVMETANGIIAIANANMAGALRLVSVQRGFDPREFTLVALGGAGPLHANALARDLSIRNILIPAGPGLATALGLLVSDIKHDYVRAYLRRSDEFDAQAVQELYSEMERQAREVLASEGCPEERVKLVRYFDVRYVGQSYELRVEAPGAIESPGFTKSLNEAFFRAHERAYGYAAASEPTEVVNLRLVAIGEIQRPRISELEAGGANAEAAKKRERHVYFAETETSVPCAVYDRYRLKRGNRIAGPAIVEEIDSTVVLHPGWHAQVDKYGNLFVQEGM